MKKSIPQKPSHVPPGAWNFYTRFDPTNASIKGQPFHDWPKLKQQNLEDYITSFFQKLFIGDASEDLWKYWQDNGQPEEMLSDYKSTLFTHAIWHAHGSMREFRTKMADEKKYKVKESIATQAAKLKKSIESAECIQGLNDYCKSQNISVVLEELEFFIKNADYGFDFNAAVSPVGRAQKKALTKRKTVAHVDFQRLLRELLISELKFDNGPVLKELVSRAQTCLYPSLETAGIDTIGRNLRTSNKTRSHKK